MAACASCYRLNPSRGARAAATFGLFITSMMVLVKIVPIVPGHFSRYEWIALANWLTLGFLVRWRAKEAQSETIVTAQSAAGSDIS